MATQFGLQGVSGANLPTKAASTITPANFSIGGMIGRFERQYAIAMLTQSFSDFQDKFGVDFSSSYYGYESAALFYQNALNGSLYVKSHVGYTGSAIDGVTAQVNLADGESVSTVAGVTATVAGATVSVASTTHGLVTGDTITVTVSSDAAVLPLGSYVITKTGASAFTVAYTGTGTTSTITYTAVATVFSMQDAYQTTLGYGIGGNRTGYTVTNGTRSSTTILTTGLKTDTFVYLTSVSDVNAGDLLKFTATSPGPATVYHLVGTVDAGSNKITLVTLAGAAAAFDGTSIPTAADVVEVLGFKIALWRKDTSGVVKAVDTSLANQWLSTQSANTKYFAENVYNAVSKYVKLTKLVTTPATLDKLFPATVATVTYLANGADGTTPTTAAHWSADLTAFDNLPARMICNPETTTATVQAAGETYCKARTDDEPKWIYTVAKDQTKAQYITAGQNFQRGDEVCGVVPATWVQIQDPFNTNPSAPARDVPPAGAVMGAWIRSITTKGIHWIPATDDMAIFGIIGLVNTNLGTISSKQQITDLMNAGINIIQYTAGKGYVLKTFNTPCTSLDYAFANAGLMKSFIKISVIDSSQSNVNEPNTFERIKSWRDGIYSFMFGLYRRGSTGSVPAGETFGQGYKVDGVTPQEADDTYSVQADAINNPNSSVVAGNRIAAIYFQRPAPTGSITVAVGISIPA